MRRWLGTAAVVTSGLILCSCAPRSAQSEPTTIDIPNVKLAPIELGDLELDLADLDLAEASPFQVSGSPPNSAERIDCYRFDKDSSSSDQRRRTLGEVADLGDNLVTSVTQFWVLDGGTTADVADSLATSLGLSVERVDGRPAVRRLRGDGFVIDVEFENGDDIKAPFDSLTLIRYDGRPAGYCSAHSPKPSAKMKPHVDEMVSEFGITFSGEWSVSKKSALNYTKDGRVGIDSSVRWTIESQSTSELTSPDGEIVGRDGPVYYGVYQSAVDLATYEQTTY